MFFFIFFFINHLEVLLINLKKKKSVFCLYNSTKECLVESLLTICDHHYNPLQIVTTIRFMNHT